MLNVDLNWILVTNLIFTFSLTRIIALVIECGQPEVNGGSQLVGSQTFTIHSTVEYQCQRGFKQVAGDTSRTCQPDGRWSGQPLVCKCEYSYNLFLLLSLIIIKLVVIDIIIINDSTFVNMDQLTLFLFQTLPLLQSYRYRLWPSSGHPQGRTTISQWHHLSQ